MTTEDHFDVNASAPVDLGSGSSMVQSAPRIWWAHGLVIVLAVVGLSGARVLADECPNPLEPMPTVVENLPDGMVRRRALEMEPTRIVFVDYMRTRRVTDTVIDVGSGWMENPSDVRRRIRYHHQFPLETRPMILLGTVASAATGQFEMDLRIGCERLNPQWSFHVIEGEADRLVLRIETVLDPGERLSFWWTVDLEIMVSGRLPADRDGDGDVDLLDLSIALDELGTNDPETEAAALRELMQSLGSG